MRMKHLLTVNSITRSQKWSPLFYIFNVNGTNCIQRCDCLMEWKIFTKELRCDHPRLCGLTSSSTLNNIHLRCFVLVAHVREDMQQISHWDRLTKATTWLWLDGPRRCQTQLIALISTAACIEGNLIRMKAKPFYIIVEWRKIYIE